MASSARTLRAEKFTWRCNTFEYFLVGNSFRFGGISWLGRPWMTSIALSLASRLDCGGSQVFPVSGRSGKFNTVLE